jgi:chemotaxis protein CheD
MNHFMLPGRKNGSKTEKSRLNSYEAEIYGIYAMESLINEILKNGGLRENLEVKITGGGKILNNSSIIGKSNIDFVRNYLKTDGLKVLGEDVGGIYPRKVYYYPVTGIVSVKRLIKLNNMTIFNREKDYNNEIQSKLKDGNMVIFNN